MFVGEARSPGVEHLITTIGATNVNRNKHNILEQLKLEQLLEQKLLDQMLLEQMLLEQKLLEQKLLG